MRTLTAAILMLLGTMGPSFVIAFVGYGAVKALGRNPSAASRIFMTMMIAFIFSEAVAVIALLVIYLINR